MHMCVCMHMQYEYINSARNKAAFDKKGFNYFNCSINDMPWKAKILVLNIMAQECESSQKEIIIKIINRDQQYFFKF